jgi:uncharacterized protein (DUF342 family)
MMIDLAELKNRMQTRLEADRIIQSVEVTGSRLEDVVQEAATLLGLPVRRIEYDIIERGTAGFMGKGAKQWKIKAYAGLAGIDEPDDGYDEEEPELVEMPESAEEKADGEVYVQLRNGDVLLKVLAPRGEGEPVTEAKARAALERRRILGYNEDSVRQMVKEAGGVYTRVAGFQHNPANDSFVRVEVSEDEMNAYVMVTPPGVGGGDVPYETFLNLLHSNGVIYGINEQSLERFADRPSYGERICVAEGKNPVDGRDSYLNFYFEVDPSKIRLKETITGAINFKELNIIQNVMAGDKLAVKMPPEEGQPGRTITGKVLPATNGKDAAIPLGNNVSVDKDGLTIVANENGQVVFNAGKIGVEKVYTVDGPVGIKTGNVIFLGSVVVNGNVEEGYSVKATGNIEVMGLVDKAALDAEGDIIVRQGITGKPGVVVRAEQMIVAKFIENATVKCGSTIAVSDGILNSIVYAKQRIVCQGKRAALIGGKISAAEEIQSKVIGSASGNTETICEVGYDPEIKENIDLFAEKRMRLQEEFDELGRNIATLESIKEQQQELPEDKAAYLAELEEKRTEVSEEINNATDKIEELKEYLTQLKTNGKVSVSAKCYPGTVIYIRDIRQIIRSEYKSVVFTASDGLFRIGTLVEEGEKGRGGKPK